MKIIKYIAVIIIPLLFVKLAVNAQSLPVGSIAIEDYYRRAQLLGVTDTNVSFTVRPVFPDSIEQRDKLLYNSSSGFKSEIGNINGSILPFSMQTQFTTHHPYGWNDGAMIPAKGFETLISGGVFLQTGILTVQFKPEIVIAQNSPFDTFNLQSYDAIFARYYDIYNNIDLPVRFGKESYFRLYPGQSSIRINAKSLSFGLSTENLWWGPGIRNSLLMSNSAPGFAHLTLNTSRPIKTPIGSFEGQIIAGRLESSGFPPLIPDYYYFGANLYVPKPGNWRYLSGIVLTWQPKWIPGLFLGFDQSRQMYGNSLNGISDYLPFFSPIKSVYAPNDPLNQKDQRNSLFMRWLWPAEHAEIYFEWGHNNSTADLQQSLLSPQDTRAYIFGLRKLIPLNRAVDENILVGIEVTQLQETSTSKILNGDEWYVNKSIPEGYTNLGQTLGAGIGPGANLQSLEVSWVKGLKKIGIQVERYLHNDDLYYYSYAQTGDFRRHWVDLSFAANYEWNYKNLIFNAKLQGIKSINYQWYLTPDHFAPGESYFKNGIDVFNLQMQAGITYRF